MMQGLHHQQQQLAALLAAALPKDDNVSSASSSTTPTSAPHSTTSLANSTSAAAAPPPTPSSEDNYEASRVAAITSLHRAICYPPNSILITHSASYLAQSFSQLLSDKSYLVRQAAATSYGALSAVLCSVPVAPNSRQNHVLIGSLVDRFIGWSLPLLSNVGDGTSELALEGLREFLSVGDVGSVERYALPILKACQELLEDESTSLSLLHRLLAVLTLISLKFFRCFQPHFVDIVDLLLGWAMVPDLAESDRRVIMDSFLQFQKHWVNNLQFSLGLLSKFLGDMDVLLQDGSPGTPQQFRRLLALLCCFSTVLQSVASGLLEINLLEQISEPLCKMVPLLLGCLSLVGRKFGWSTWIEDSWRCLTLLAEILSEKFSTFYPAALDILFQSLEMPSKEQLMGNKKISTFQVHGVLKTNLHLLSLLKLGLSPSSVHKMLQLNAPISQLRLHPNHLVTGSSAATYVFLLQHGNNEVVERTTILLIEELELLKNMVDESPGKRNGVNDFVSLKCYSMSELIALIKFDLKVLLNSVSLAGGNSVIGRAEIYSLYVNRSQKLASHIIQKLNPCELPIVSCIEMQVTVLNTLERLTTVEFLSKWSIIKESSGNSASETAADRQTEKKALEEAVPEIFFENLNKYAGLLIRALESSSPLVVKIEALQWICKLCENVINIYQHLEATYYPCVSCYVDMNQDLLFSVLNAASDREPKVRLSVVPVLEMFLRGKLIHPSHFPLIAEIVLEKLGDPDKDIKTAYVKLLSDILPIAVYACGLRDSGVLTALKSGSLKLTNGSILHWKQLFAIRQLPQQLHSQQLVSILSYISQRWKAPLSSWIRRLIQTCRRSKDLPLTQSDEARNLGPNGLWWDIKPEEDFLERVCLVNIFSGAWWAIHEAARYCITTRLRTNLGGPTQTFAALERMLLDTAHVLQLDTEQTDGNLNIVGSTYAHLLPMRLLLDFVEALKKNVYNAYEGSIVLPCTPRPSSLFFRANRKVCEEWFSRICEPMMNAGLALQSHDATIHYCKLRLQELSSHVSSSSKDKSRTSGEKNHSVSSRSVGEVVRVLRHLALALCKNHEPEVLIGLQKWASITFSEWLQDEHHSKDDAGISGHFLWIDGLVYQAKGQHEKAGAHFVHLLQTEESLTSLGSEGVQFAIARIIENYAAVTDWKSLESFLSELQTLRAMHAGKSYSGALTTAGNEINSIQALAYFDEGDFQASWACLDLTPKSSSELTLDPKLALQRSEQMLLQAMLLQSGGKGEEVSHELLRGKLMLEEALSVLPLDGIVEAAPYINQLCCISAFEESSRFGGGEDKYFGSLLGSYIQALHSPVNHIRQDCSMWLKVFRVFRTTHPASPATLKLCSSILTLAYKQKNLILAGRLTNYLKDHSSGCSDANLRDFITSSLQYEGILLMHAENKLEDAFINLWAFVHPCMVSSPAVPNSIDNSLKAMACLKLSKWLKKYHTGQKLENIVLKMQSDFKVAETYSDSAFPSFSERTLSSKQGVDLVVEEIVGISTKLSTLLCPTMGKSWISYASWCYDQARASVSLSREVFLTSCSSSSIIASEIYPERFSLTDQERLEVKNILSRLPQRSFVKVFNEDGGDIDVLTRLDENLQNENDAEVLSQQVINIIEAAAGGPGMEDLGKECLSATVSSELQNLFVSKHITLDEARMSLLVGDLINVWWTLRRRRVSLFGHAAQAFIKYLSCSSSKCYNGQLSCSAGESKYKSVGFNMRATLYVLHILLNFGVELQDKLEPALSTVPLVPWQEIIPQLFSRLSSHCEKVVRKQLENLLIMLAKRSPWSIVYPTLVDANAYGNEPSEELHHVLACLNKLHPRLVQDVQLMIKELKNITVLWEELWLSTLQDLHADVMRRINLLKEEAARVSENATLSHSEKNKINAAKYSAMMAPVIVVLERRLASTSREPETPHEKWFVEEFRDPIRSAILNFKTPPTSAAALGDVWRPFGNIAASLASHQRKSSLSLGEVSPQLALLSSSEAPMPGLEKEVVVSESDSGLLTPKGIVTVASFSEQVTILSTKTKPKKIHLLGSDGQKYPYLLKGREDLRLDARIMQLLEAVNGFLHSSSATRGQPLGIRYYSVTPISGQAGLIQWVDNVISIYTVFKSWQSRVQLAQLSAQGAGDTCNMALPPVPRPIDMFYGKIIPALKEKGIRRVISRRDWPQEVKRKVLLDLMKEVPKQILHQELWCASEGFKAFSSKQKRYSGSLAAMSVVGHVLGLGDRHLDNILIDFRTGDILHIDYNVCFDKGQRLKVPEIVPFRLTQTVEAALGLTGIEGTFRAYCEEVIGVLKRNKDIILMLLEAFVWDPLVEWTRGDFHDDAAIVGEERKGMELAVSLSLFASRVQEIRVPLQEHQDLLLTTLPSVESALERFEKILNQYEIVAAVFFHADQERANLTLHETSAKSVVAEATSNLEKIRASLEIQAREFAQAQGMVIEKAKEVTSWMEQHGRVLDALRSSSIPEIKAGFKLSGGEEALSLAHAVVVAGVPLTIVPEPTQAQCHDIDGEVFQIIAELDSGLSSAVAALQTYSVALQRILPVNYHTTSPVHGWEQVLQLAVSALSSDIISLARKQGSDIIGKVRVNDFDSVKRNYDSLCLNVGNYAAEIDRVEEEYAELVNSIGPDTETRAKNHLLSAFVDCMQSAGLDVKEEALGVGVLKHAGSEEVKFIDLPKDKKESVSAILNAAASIIYSGVKHRLLNGLNHSTRGRNVVSGSQSGIGAIFCELEEQIEKSMLVAGFVGEFHQYISGHIPDLDSENHSKGSFRGNWASVFRTCLLSSKNLVGQMIENVLPEAIKSFISFSSEVMDVFGSVSQIRGSIDKALEQLIEVELERASLVELERNYFVQVGRITEQQLALEEAALKGRDHLSWEEAEELSSQEEACRVQLDELHKTWNQKDVRTSSLTKKEASVRGSLLSLEQYLQSLTVFDHEEQTHMLRSKALLAALLEPFSELESVDQALSSFGGSTECNPCTITQLADRVNSGCPISHCIWMMPNMPHNHAFFVWKVSVIDSFLDSCTHDTATSIDLNLGFDQLVNVVKKKLETQLQEHIGQYLKERLVPSLISQLDKESETPKQISEARTFDHMQKEFGVVKKLQLLLEEYCSAHETVRAARSAASLMKRQVKELKEALLKTSLEIIQMEWMHDISLIPLHNNRLICRKLLASEDDLMPILLSISRPKLLESMKSCIAKIANSLDSLQACEQNSVVAEGQLERAMSWACGGPSSSAAGNTVSRNSGIPQEFHDHLMRRRQHLQDAREKVSNFMNVCISVLEFEASRDGIFRTPAELYPLRTGSEGNNWQEVYLKILTKLEVTYHSFTRAEQEWKLAQSNVEAASSGLFSVSNELSIASVKAQSASGDMQSILLAMRDVACDASVVLAAYGDLTRGHTALTIECGSMLEEVLAITESLHDVHNLGKEAAALHSSMMENLAKASAFLLPLESVLAKDVAAMTDAMARDSEIKMELSPIHGQAIFQSYFTRVKEARQSLKPLVPPLTSSVRGLHSMLTRLARTASLHAGNLHKALEGLGESQELRSQDTDLLRSDLADLDDVEVSKGAEIFIKSNGENDEKFVGLVDFSLQDKGWISPPESISSGSESGITSNETSLGDSPNGLDIMDSVSHSSDSRGTESFSHNLLSVETDPQNILSLEHSNSGNILEHSDDKFIQKVETSFSSQDKIAEERSGTSVINTEISGHATKGKNAYAMSMLRRVEMKIDGRDIAENRDITVAEQVDFLLKQATSLDNLCNMYEGWTPWI